MSRAAEAMEAASPSARGVRPAIDKTARNQTAAQSRGMTAGILSVVRAFRMGLSSTLAFAANSGRRDRSVAIPGQIEERYRVLVDAMDDAVNLKDRDGHYLMVNPEQAHRLGRREEDIVGRTPLDLYDRATAKRIMEQHEEVVRSGTAQEMEQRYSGSPDPVVRHVHRIPLRDDSGRVAAVLTVSRDITEMAHLREVLRCQALEDELTGLYNRRGFMTLAEHHLRLADRMGTQLCLVFIDMDNLKAVNDTFGHQRGDDAIATVARTLKESCRESDVVARFGGDEFAILAIDASPDKVAALVQRLRDNFAVISAEEWSAHPLSLSIGVVQRDAGCPLSIDTLLSRADSLMYEEKQKKAVTSIPTVAATCTRTRSPVRSCT